MKKGEFRVGRTTIEERQVLESSANGRAEEPGKRARDQAMVLKEQMVHPVLTDCHH